MRRKLIFNEKRFWYLFCFGNRKAIEEKYLFNTT